MQFILPLLLLSSLATGIPQGYFGSVLERAGEVLVEPSVGAVLSISTNTNKVTSTVSGFFERARSVFFGSGVKEIKAETGGVESVLPNAVDTFKPVEGFKSRTVVRASEQEISKAQAIKVKTSSTSDLPLISKYEDFREGVTVNGFKLIKKLGSGEYGKVFKAELANTEGVVAVKVFKHYIPPAEAQLNRILSRFPEVNGKILEPFKVGEHWVMPLKIYENARTLEDVLYADPKYAVKDARQALFEKARQQLELVYEKGFTYNDVHGKNFLVDENGEVTIIDFGMARPFSDFGSRQSYGVTRAREFDFADLSDEFL